MNQETPIPRFDDSLALFVSAIAGVLGKRIVEEGKVLRDASGRLAFISSNPLSTEQRESVAQAAQSALPAYCREGSVVFYQDQPGVSSILRRARGYTGPVTVDGEELRVNVLEQRIVGADWLEAPAATQSHPPRFVFASIKGGVGRSTALAVVATEMAREGGKVLVVDMDLEAPGIGAMLLPQDELPRYGLIDAYVENGLGGVDRDFLLDMVAASPFGRGRGLIDVVPAVGSLARQYPANVLAKIARAYLEIPGPDGEMLSFIGQTQHLINGLAGLKQYGAVLIDARAGLNESTAAAILGLGAQVLLFGEDTPQTFAGYRYLLAHLARFPRDSQDDWLPRLRMVHAKASADAGKQQAFRDRAHAVFQEFLYQEESLVDEAYAASHGWNVDDLTLPEYSLEEPEAPHYAWPVLRDSNYFEFDPLTDPSHLTPALYERTYQALLDGVNPVRLFDDVTEAQP